MSLGLTKPGLHAIKYHPKTGKAIAPLYVRADGTVVWPVLGASSEDPDDADFTGASGGKVEDDDDADDSDDDDADEDSDDEDDKSKKKSKKDDDDDEDDEDEDRARRHRASRQAAKYRTQLRESQAANRKLEERLRAIEDKDKKPDEVATRDLAEARSEVDKLNGRVSELVMENAWLKANTIEWADKDDALAAATRLGLLDDVIESDGTVDTKAMRAALRELARKKPHLVKSKTTRGSAAKDDDEDDDTDSRSAPSMNGTRKGTKGKADRSSLAKRFPVLGR